MDVKGGTVLLSVSMIFSTTADYDSYTIIDIGHFVHDSQFQDGCAQDRGQQVKFYIESTSKILRILKLNLFEIKAPVSLIIRPNPDRILRRQILRFSGFSGS